MRIIHALLALATLSLPFSYALTLNIGFPLKIYEVCLFLALPLFLLMGQGQFCLKHWKFLGLFFFFISATLVTLFYRLDYPGAGYDIESAENRFSPFTDSALKIGYAALNFGGFFLYGWFANKEPNKFLNYWITGAVISALYSIYCFLFSSLSLPVYILPGIDVVQYFSDTIIRNGTFLEGNYSGLFYLISAVLAIKQRNFLACAILALGVVSSISTASILMLLGTIVIVVGFELRHIRFVTFLTIVLNVAFLVAIFFVSVSQTKFGGDMVDKILVEKQGVEPSDSAFSRDNRLDTAVTGLRMFDEHPLIGVGIAQYTYYYLSKTKFPIKNWVPQRVIPNNVYAEVLGETGLIGSIPFFISVLLVFAFIYKARDFYFMLAIVEVLVAWNAFPSFSIMYIWAFFGGAVGYLSSPMVLAQKVEMSAREQAAVREAMVLDERKSKITRGAYHIRRRRSSLLSRFRWPSIRIPWPVWVMFGVILIAEGLYLFMNRSPVLGEIPPQGFIMGINGKAPEQEMYEFIPPEEQMKLIRELGISWYRVAWSDQSTPEQIDRILNAADAAHITILPVLTPRMDLKMDRPLSEYEAEAEKYARKWVGRYSSRVKTWELQNELDVEAILKKGDINPANGKSWDKDSPDGSEILHYDTQRLARTLAVLKGLSQGVAAVQPSATRLIGTAGWKHYGFLKAVEQAGIPYELIAWHWYSEMGTLTNAGGTNVLRELRQFHRDIWITESGRRDGSISHAENEQATYYQRDFPRMVSYYPQVKAYFVYELLDEPTLGLMNGESYYGMLKVEVDEDGKWKISDRKPAFNVIQSHAKWLYQFKPEIGD